MHCPFCRHPDSRVVDSRETDEGQAIRRRRSCPECGKRFTTVETAVLAVVKDAYAAHKRIVFNGDGYSDDWHAEAEARGSAEKSSTGQVACARHGHASTFLRSGTSRSSAYGMLVTDEADSAIESCRSVTVTTRPSLTTSSSW